ncbi:MAG: hypothetical protein AMXMBFR55_03690 [Gemmatimonadota bacterium]
MDGMTDDEKFDHWLQSAARDYNRPAGDAPREAMWAAIEAVAAHPQHGAHGGVVRDGHGASRAIGDGAGRGVGALPARRLRFTPHLWQAAAALLLLAGGIGIGRVWQRSTAPEPALAAAGRSPDTTRGQASAPPSLASAPSVARGAAALAGSPAGSPAASESYDIVTVQHLSRAEALLTSFRAGGGGDTATAGTLDRWARDLLADTRLLLDSPAASDARRRHLLEDLELVLAQIVQLPAESSADRALVQRSIERGAVLSRLRSTIPAGFGSGT